ncbi:MAG TPA: response regulator transcription factor [Phycisphaerales bacterium]|nr:response regulator transcription factor [Phycisphaerales bacterium]
MSTRHRILCVDDSIDLSEMILRMLSLEPDLEPVGSLHSAEHLVQEIEAKLPDIALLDLTMPGRDPLDALRELTAQQSACKVIVMSGYDDPQTVATAMDAGAWGFVSKHQEIPALIKAIRTVASGSIAIPGR